MTDFLPAIIFFVVLIVMFSSSLKIVGEGERLAIFALGRFHSYRGPGLVLVIPFVQQVTKLKIGETGLLINKELAKFGEVDIPVTNTESMNIGQTVRIDGFDDAKPRLVASADRPANHCPKCGHEY